MNDETPRIYLCSGANCNARGRAAVEQALRDELWAQGLDSRIDVRSSGCQDRCEHGPNAKIWPGPWNYARLTPEAIRTIVCQHLRDGQPVTAQLATPGDWRRPQP